MDNEASPSTWNISYSLLIALRGKEEKIVWLLLERGANVNTVRGQYGTALAAAVYGGEEKIVRLLLDRGADINMAGGKYETALAVAAYCGKIDILSLLLDRGADVNMVGGGLYGTALAAAAYYGQIDIVRLLLDRGADINTVGGEYGTALTAAAFQENMDIMRLLLHRGANVNMVGGKSGTALAAAAKSGKTAIVSLLLDQGANVNMVGGLWGTALAVAAYWGLIDIVSLLLDREADINLGGVEYGTPLAAAAYRGKIDTVRLLLDRGADVNLVWGEYGTALAAAAAAYGGEEKIISLLLDRGANVNMVGGKYGTALAAAAYRGSSAILRLLLDQGADVNLVGGKWGTALAAAAYCGKIVIVRLLLDRGADVNLVGSEYGTALAAAAAYHGKIDIVSLLLDRGADVNLVGGEYGTALAAAAAAAAYHGEEKIVSLLLDRGANVNMVGGKYGTALAAAAYRWKIDIVSLLLDREADVNLVGGEYGAALAAAAFQENMDIMRLLLHRGANINMVSGDYGTALAAATCTGKRSVVSLLLDRGANINKVGGNYGTALATAAYNGEGSITSLLLDRGANIDQVGGKYGTALATAAAGWSPHPALLLLDRGADINILVDEYATTLLTAAAFEGVTSLVSLLLDRGTDVNTVCSKYGTALAAAVLGGRTDITSLLLEHGAHPAGITDLTRVCGSYSTAIEKHPVEKQNGPRHRLVYPVDNGILWPPFPMPYIGSNHHNVALSSSLSSPDILSTKFCAGGNLTPEQADVPCRRLKEEALWTSLAALVGLHDDITLANHQWIRYDLCYFVIHNFDFGTAYAAARVAWKSFSKFESSMYPSTIFNQRNRWHKRAQMLQLALSKVIEIDSNQVKFTSDNQCSQPARWSTTGDEKTNRSSSIQVQQELIVSPYSVMPRRIWDLKSNRVIDFRMLHAAQPTIETRPNFWAVTHSWTSNMTPVLTEINQFQWPVPLPKGISIEYLRSELLTLGAEYVWLDVICLRQRSEVDSLEQLRQQEWKLDVPTIGNIYRAAAKIVRYFNGLGVPFSNDGWGDSRHWLCRAWTLQEIASEKNTINGAIPRDLRDPSQRCVFLNSQGTVSGKLIKFRSAISPVIQLAAQVDSVYGCDIYELAREMAGRQSTEPLDKLSGLFYLLHTTKLPCYDEHKTGEDIWRECFHLLPLERRVEILFNFPYRGSDKQWFPTWAQILDWPTRDPEYHHVRPLISQDLARDDTLGEISFIRNIWTIPGVTLCESNYPGEYRAETNGRLFGFYVPYLLQKPIDIEDSVFTLATVEVGYAYNWVVCEAIGKKAGESVGLEGVAEVTVLRKIGVLRTDSCSEIMVGGPNGASLLEQVDCLFV